MRDRTCPRVADVVLLTLSLATPPTEGLAAKSSLAQQTQTIRATIGRDATIAWQEAADSWITLKTQLAILAIDGVSGLGVDVSTHHRVVTLRGKVDSDAARQAADGVARAVKGQKRVVDDLVVVPKAERPAVDRQDARITRAVQSRLGADANLSGSRIAARTDGGIVTLTGRAASLEASVQASEDARRAPGVRAVQNDLALDTRG